MASSSKAFRGAGLLLAALLVHACSFDNDVPAPYSEPAFEPGACGTTETLFARLLGFVRSEQMEPLRQVIEARLVESEDGPSPDPSMRNVLGAAIRIIVRLGIEATAETAATVANGAAAEELTHLLVSTLQFAAGQIDGVQRFDATDALAFFIDRCPADNLLFAAESVARLRSQERDGQRWLVAFLEELALLFEDPELAPFLDGFETSAQSGRPAVVSLFDQVLGFMADEDFDVDRVRTLLESAVYPLVQDPLEARMEALLRLLSEAADPEAGLFVPLQRAVRCGLDHDEPRMALLGFVYDLSSSDALDLRALLSSASRLAADAEQEIFIEHLADLARAIREEERASEDILEVVSILIRSPESEKTLPVLIELFDRGVAAELFQAVSTLLSSCEAEQGAEAE